MFFWNCLAFCMIQQMLAIWSLVSLPFLNPAWTSGSSRFTYCWMLKPTLENFEHYFASVWDECNCEVVWTSFSIAFLWNWNENQPQSCGHCWVFQICWHIEWRTLTSSFRTWNSSAGISSSLLALVVVMFAKACLTSHSRKCVCVDFTLHTL